MSRSISGMPRLLCALIPISLVLSSCGPKPKAGDKLVIISPHWEGIKEEYERAFSQWAQQQFHQSVKFEWPDVGGTSEELRYVRSQFSRTKSGIGIDLFFGGGIDPYGALEGEGLLESYKVKDELLKSVPAELHGVPLYDGETFTWYGAALSGFGLMYNKKVLEADNLPTPSTWADLARPEFLNEIAMVDPRKSGSAHMMYEIVLQAYGWQKGWGLLAKMAANSRSFKENASDAAKDVRTGEAACAPSIDFYAWSEMAAARQGEMVFILPKNLTVINPDGIAILKGAPHREWAQRFVDFVLSEAGQKLLMLPVGENGGPSEYTLGRMAILPSLFDSLGSKALVKLNPFKWQSDFRYDSPTGAKRWNVVNDLVGALLIDARHLLKAAWKKQVHAAGASPRSPSVLLVPPVTEAQANELAARWSDPTYRNTKLGEWAKWAERQY